MLYSREKKYRCAYHGSDLVLVALEAEKGRLPQGVPDDDGGVLAAADEHGALAGIAQRGDGALRCIGVCWRRFFTTRTLWPRSTERTSPVCMSHMRI